MDKVVHSLIEDENGHAGVLLVGSHTRKENAALPSDKDFIIVTPDDGIERLTRRIRAHSGFQEVSDDSFRVVVPETEYGLCLLSRAAFQQRIDGIFSQDFVQRDWALGCVMPEGFSGDVEYGVIESDTQDLFLRQTKDFISSHKTEYIARLTSETVQKLRSLTVFLQKHGSDPVKYEVIKGQILIFLVRLFYLQNREFCKGIKHFSQDTKFFGEGQNVVGLIHMITRGNVSWKQDLCDLLLK